MKKKKRGKPASAKGIEELRQNLRRKVLFNEATAERLVGFERDERTRKGLPDASEIMLLELAIERWEREQ